MNRYTLSPEAQQDLRDIRDFLLSEAGLHVSRHVMRAIANALRFLSDVPGAGHVREDLTAESLKFWQVFSYLIVYDHTARPIGIVRILHTSRDVSGTLARI